jgi:predicted acyltransferase
LYAVAPLVSGLDSILYGRIQAGVLYLMLGLLFAVLLFFINKLPWQNSRILQTAGAVMLITISFDMFRQGRNIVPYLYIFAAVLNVYVLYAGDTVQREKRKVNR